MILEATREPCVFTPYVTDQRATTVDCWADGLASTDDEAKYWRQPRAHLDSKQLEQEFGPITVPEQLEN